MNTPGWGGAWIEIEIRGSRSMLRSLRYLPMCALTTSSPSSEIQTTVTCGLPSGSIVTTCASGPESISARSSGVTTLTCVSLTSHEFDREFLGPPASWQMSTLKGGSYDEARTKCRGCCGVDGDHGCRRRDCRCGDVPRDGRAGQHDRYNRHHRADRPQRVDRCGRLER